MQWTLPLGMKKPNASVEPPNAELRGRPLADGPA